VKRSRITLQVFAAMLCILSMGTLFIPALADVITARGTSGVVSQITVVKRPRIALVLGGGGMRGYAHVGVLKVLTDNHIPIDMLVGTSMGAVIGGAYCAGITPDQLARDPGKPFIHAFFKESVFLQLLSNALTILRHRSPEGIMSGKQILKDSSKAFGNSFDITDCHIPFAAVAVDLTDGQPYTLTSGNFGSAIQASTAIPLIRKPVHRGEQVLVDAGILANIPVKQARELGADFVIAVSVDHSLYHMIPDDFHRKLGSVSDRVLDVILNKLDADELKNADVAISPNVDQIPLLSKSVPDARKAIEAGTEATWVQLPTIFEKLKQAGISIAPVEK
jgi:NTE family protein